MFLFLVFALLLVVLVMLTPVAQALSVKLTSYAHGFKFMVTADDLPEHCRCSNYIPMQAPPTGGHNRRVVRVVFIRHGQSVWNSLFNSRDLFWPLHMVKALVFETVYLFRNPFDSVFIDSPLSPKGINEAQDLAQFVRTAGGKISFDTNTSLVVCSNLRRAMETAIIGLTPRRSFTQERFLIDSSLQEGSRNIDAQTLSTERGKMVPCKMAALSNPQELRAAFDARLNAGNRTSDVNVYGRMDVFVSRLFGGAGSESYAPASRVGAENTQLREVLVVGHSGYFRCFFRRFLPSSSQHLSKMKKMQNCAVVAFDLVRNESTNEIFIDESTITVLYKGFETG